MRLRVCSAVTALRSEPASSRVRPGWFRSRRVFGAAAERWEVVPHAGRDELEKVFGLGQALEVVRAEIAEGHAGQAAGRRALRTPPAK